MKDIKKFRFFFFLKKVKRQRTSQTRMELICAATNMSWSHSGQITCRAIGFHVYLLHHIFATGAKYNGIDALYYKLDQSSTVSTAHSGSQAHKQVWQMQCQWHNVTSLWCPGKRLHSTHYVPLHILSPLCSGYFAATVREPAGQCRACAWPQLRNTGMGKIIKRGGRWEVSVSTLLQLFVKNNLLSSFDLVE